MGPKTVALSAVVGVAALGGCASGGSYSKSSYWDGSIFARPPAADAYSALLIARYASLNNDPSEAVAQYASVLHAVPPGDEIAARGVYAALLSGDFSQAATFAARADGAASGTGRTSLTDLTLAVKSLSEGRDTAALGHLDLATYGPFNRAMAVNVLAWLTLETDGLAAAEAVLAQADGDAFAVPSVALAMAGLLQSSAGEDDRALATFNRLDASGPRLAMATEAQARLLASAGRADEARARLASFRQDVGPHPVLAELDRSIAAGKPVSAPRLTTLQGAALGIYGPAAALAARTDSDLPAAYFVLALELDPSLDVARTLWADALDRNGRRDEAVSVLRAVPESSAFFPTAQGQLAWALRQSGDDEGALAIARAALETHPDRDLKVQLSELLVSMVRDDDAERLLTEIIDEDAERGRADWRMFFARGAARERMGNWAGAETDLQHALTLAPDNPEIMNHLGYGWVDRHRNLHQALIMLERAAELRPSAGEIIDSLGWAYYRLGRIDEAIAQLERAVSLSPTSFAANDHLGDAYWRAGRHLEATFQWERALSLGPAEDMADGLRQKLIAGLPPRGGVMVGASLSGLPEMQVQP
ncbi:MAG: tetratricopeptide repeat protein [Pseudomonadota bacterium]